MAPAFDRAAAQAKQRQSIEIDRRPVEGAGRGRAQSRRLLRVALAAHKAPAPDPRPMHKQDERQRGGPWKRGEQRQGARHGRAQHVAEGGAGQDRLSVETLRAAAGANDIGDGCARAGCAVGVIGRRQVDGRAGAVRCLRQKRTRDRPVASRRGPRSTDSRSHPRARRDEAAAIKGRRLAAHRRDPHQKIGMFGFAPVRGVRAGQAEKGGDVVV